jgi:hypothetical protein
LVVGCALAVSVSPGWSPTAVAGGPRQVAQAAETPSYRPPLRGAPGGRVGAASRGDMTVTIEPLSPDAHSGLTASASPTLFYFISSGTNLPVKFAVRSPSEVRPLIDTTIPAPRAAGIQAIRLTDYRVQLQPDITYTWSVSLVVDPRAPSNDVVGTATIVRAAADAALDSAVRGAAPLQQAALYAQHGFWYDAVAAAVVGGNTDRHAALDALLDQVGLPDVASADRATAR